MGYNGWTNYETWLVNLWMDNEPGGKEFAFEYLRGCTHPKATVSGITYSLSCHIKETYAEGADDLDLPPFWKDLLNGALSEVNWYETASHIMEEWKERKERVEQWDEDEPYEEARGPDSLPRQTLKGE